MNTKSSSDAASDKNNESGQKYGEANSANRKNHPRVSPEVLRGTRFFHDDDAESVAAFFIDSALNKGATPPPHFILVCGEIIFSNSQIGEVRLGGHYNWGSTVSGSVLTNVWESSPAPAIKLSENFGIDWDAIENNEEFIAAFKYKDEMRLAWNITAATMSLMREQASPAFKSILSAIQNPDCSEENSPSSKNKRKYITRIEDGAQNFIENFGNLIIDSISTDNSGLFNLSHSDEFGTIGYTFVQQKIKEELEKVISETIDYSPAAVKRTMEEFGLGEQKAREYIEVQKLINIKNFIRTGLPKYKERGEKILADTAVNLRREGTILATVDYRGKENDAYANAVKRKGFDEATSDLRKRWEIKSGTPTGKRPVSENKKKAEAKKKYDVIAQAIADLYELNFKKLNDENAAEKAVTMEAVAAAVKKTPQTIQIYVKSIKDFFEPEDFARADLGGEQTTAYAIFRLIKAKTLEKFRAR